MLIAILIFLGAVSTAFAYYIYFQDTKQEKIRPNRWSWFIWSVATGIEALTYEAVSNDLTKSALFFFSALACIVVTILVWKKGRWKAPNKTELITTIVAFVSLVLWLIFEQTLWAHVLIITTVPIAFWPTWKGARRGDEDSHAWKLWSIGDLCALLVILLRYENAIDLPYAIIELGSHAIVWWLAFKYRAKYIQKHPDEKQENLFHIK